MGPLFLLGLGGHLPLDDCSHIQSRCQHAHTCIVTISYPPYKHAYANLPHVHTLCVLVDTHNTIYISLHPHEHPYLTQYTSTHTNMPKPHAMCTHTYPQTYITIAHTLQMNMSQSMKHVTQYAYMHYQTTTYPYTSHHTYH